MIPTTARRPGGDSRLRALLFRSPTATRAARVAKAVTRRATMKVHDPDFNALALLAVDSGLAIDVGANAGQSAVSILAVKPGFEVLSLEPNPSCRQPLSTLSILFGARLRVLNVGAADEPGELTFYVPVRSGRELIEEGTFDRSSLDTTATIERIGHIGVDYTLNEIVCPIVKVDDLDRDPCFVKIDVQGLELQVLRGMASTIERSRPLVMIERGVDEDSCTSFLSEFGYLRRYWDGNGLSESPGESVNTFYVPAG
jgi:FkbM family methyltransferase